MLPGPVVRGRPNPLHWKFPARLRRARREAKLSAAALSSAAGIGKSSVSQIEANLRLPRLPTVERLADALHLSPAWLAFGLESAWEPRQGAAQRCEGLAARAQQARLLRGLTPQALGQRSCTSGNEVRAIEAATMPTLDTVEQLAKALGVSPAWLAYGLGPMEGRARQANAEENAEPNER